MNIISFVDLLRRIYGKKLPDLDAIQRKGLLAVKIAQHFALRIDFLDEKVCRHLARLYQQALPVSAQSVTDTLTESIPPSWRDRVKDLSPAPLATASLGQVHSACLDTGDDVVVKIIKSDFAKSFSRDIRSLRRWMRFVTTVYPKLQKVFDPVSIIDHIQEYTISEMDLKNEIAGQRVLQSIAETYGAGYDLSRLRFHRIYEDLTTSRVLVAERISGRSFDDLLTEGKLAYEDLLALFNIHGFYLFGAGVFHGDIHPGNVFLDEHKNICLIDTGALSAIGTKIKNGLFDFFIALADFDYPACGQALRSMAQNTISDDQFAVFQKRFLTLYDGFEGATVSEVSLTKKMMDTIKLAVHNGMRFERGMFAIIKGLMYMDGMVLRCNPDAVLMKDMKPFVSVLKPLITDGPFKKSLELDMANAGFRA